MLPPEVEELRFCLDRVRAMLESLIVRGLRACGPEPLAQLRAHAEELERCGARHVAAVLSTLHEQIEQGSREGVKTLLRAQTTVRLLERLLTVRAVGGQYAMAMRIAEMGTGPAGVAADGDEEGEEE